MMKSRLSLKSLARTGFNLLIPLILIFPGCSSSTSPTYLKEDINKAIEDICRNEYKIDVKVKWAGSTLWVYLPLEDILEKIDKPQKYFEKFAIEQNTIDFKKRVFRLKYLIKSVPEQEKYQEAKYKESASNKISSVWRVIRRVLFSMETAKNKEPKFLYFIIADIKNGFKIKELVYYPDLKKVSYEFISWKEYQHRSIQETELSPDIIGDKEGFGLDYTDITFEEFIIRQIKHRIDLKFNKPEVDKGADINKEILKIVVYTLKTYDFKDFLEVELNNSLTENKIILNQKAVLERPTD